MIQAQRRDLREPGPGVHVQGLDDGHRRAAGGEAHREGQRRGGEGRVVEEVDDAPGLVGAEFVVEPRSGEEHDANLTNEVVKR